MMRLNLKWLLFGGHLMGDLNILFLFLFFHIYYDAPIDCRIRKINICCYNAWGEKLPKKVCLFPNHLLSK